MMTPAPTARSHLVALTSRVRLSIFSDMNSDSDMLLPFVGFYYSPGNSCEQKKEGLVRDSLCNLLPALSF